MRSHHRLLCLPLIVFINPLNLHIVIILLLPFLFSNKLAGVGVTAEGDYVGVELLDHDMVVSAEGEITCVHKLMYFEEASSSK